MPEDGTTQVIHTTVNGKYRMVLERSAVKGIDGFKVEANGDDIDLVRIDAGILYDKALKMTVSTTSVEVK